MLAVGRYSCFYLGLEPSHSRRNTYPVVDKNLALLLALGLGHANRGDHVEGRDSQLLGRICLLLGLFHEQCAVLLLELLRHNGALGLLGLGHTVGGRSLVGFTAGRLASGMFTFHRTGPTRCHRIERGLGAVNMCFWRCEAELGVAKVGWLGILAQEIFPISLDKNWGPANPANPNLTRRLVMKRCWGCGSCCQLIIH